MKTIILVFALATAAAASTAGQMADEAQAEWEQVKRTTRIWTCTCVNGRSVYSFKTMQQMEDESNALVARERELAEKLSRSTNFIGVKSNDPAAIKALASQLASICQ
jgi:hypothetical protein